ncbi:tenascin [Alosa sapidissima]|uniref:tenascin n=1 Tax=Alosa sapidissima TaxID=34773 RepID=UPI001C0A2192|nr:tenascin [Alosa sapidissima]XP_041963773.1 tenascin [Alosa sapidissima]XP_041963774.1 tenascin [Alosa sapidissima]
MLISIAVLLLLCPLSSLQTPTSLKRNTTGTSLPSPGVTLSLPKPITTTLNAKQKTQSPPLPPKSSPAKANQTFVLSSPAKTTPAPVAKVLKEKAAPHSHPIKVVITDGCAQKDQKKEANRTSVAQEKELTLKPGSPLVMTHHISLVPSTCIGGCEAEMAALKGRVEYLEKEMVAMKKICTSCSAGRCPNNCSDQGRCEDGKCVCNAGFSGADCSSSACPSNCNKKGKCVKGKCVCNPGFSGMDCSKGSEKKTKVTVETVTMKVTPESNAIKETTTTTVKKTKADKTLFMKKTEADKEQKKVLVVKKEEQGKGSDASQTKAKTIVKTSILKTDIVTKVTAKTPAPSNGTKTGKTVVKTVGQVFLKQSGRRPEQATKGKTEVRKIDTKVKVTTKQESTADKSSLKKVQLKDQPILNVTQTSVKKTNGLTELVKGSKASVNGTSSEKTVLKTTKVVKTTGTQATNSTVKVTVKTGLVKLKPTLTNATATEKDKKLFQANATIVLKEGPVVKKKVESQLNVTIEAKLYTKQTNKTSSKSASSVVTVVVQNITSTSFILTWEASQGLFRNFTVSRRELPAGVEDKEEEVVGEEAEKGKFEKQDVTVTGNLTELIKQSTNKTASSTKLHVSSTTKAEGKNVRKFTQVLSGTARSFQFRNLRPQTHYALSLFGTAPGFRSKIYRVIVTTGPEPPSEMVFTNITETSVSVSWTKPKNTVTGFKVIYTNTATGASGSLTMDSQLSTVVISKLSAGSSYEISVTSTLESSESDAVTATVITAPDSPTNLQAVNVTDTKALLAWKPAQAKVDRYILSYGSSKSPNVTVTVMLSGSTMEHQLRGLHRATLYTVRLVSQLNSLQSSQVSTTFTTASGVKVQAVAPSTVTSRSALITWKAPHVAFKTYKLTYQVPGQEAKEVLLSPTVIQYELTGLLAGSNYSVKVEGEKEGSYVTVVSTEFTTGPGAVRFPHPTDCSQVQLNGVQESGEAEIFPEGQEGEAVLVYCDMETEGGGWTVFQRRVDGKTDFFRGWKDYSKGFGFLSDEFWLGNDHLHTLTRSTPMSLRVDLHSGNDTAYAHYANFSIASEENNYTIYVSGYSGNAGDSLRYHSGRPFSTKDKDPHPLSIHCAKAYMGGWWYKNCYKANLNGLYATFSENQGVVWIDWKGKDTSIPFTEMKLRPASFPSATQG